MAPQKVYIVLRTDYLSADDYEGHLVFLSAHATPASAKTALEAHVKTLNKQFKLKSPNTKESKYEDALAGTQVIVGLDDFHSYDVRVCEEELVGGGEGGEAKSDMEEAKEVGEEKAEKADGKGEVKGKGAKRAAPKEEGVDGEEGRRSSGRKKGKK